MSLSQQAYQMIFNGAAQMMKQTNKKNGTLVLKTVGLGYAHTHC